MKYILYGATGYTAQLIIQESLSKGLRPTLAGRNLEKLRKLANKYKLDYLCFPLENAEQVAKEIVDFELCLNAAGPFNQTAKIMIEACLLSSCHYLDITGEIGVFELAKSYDKEAKNKKIILLPGVGFDVVPSDCLANYLHEKMPNGQNLELAFTSIGGALSHGTASTMLENLGEGSAARVNGKIVKVPLGHLAKKIDFGEVKQWTMTIPWGDVSTAYSSTKIPNIVVYTAVPKSTINLMKFQSFFNPILKTKWLKGLLQKWVDKNLHGPDSEKNQKGKSLLWGELSSADGTKLSALLKCKEGYLLTALCAVHICLKVLDGNFKVGYQTPASAYGPSLILEIEGSEITDL